MGSYDPMLSSFTPTKYLGTTNSTSCVTGYDQAAFVAATSSGVFNQFNISVGVLFLRLFYLCGIAHFHVFVKIQTAAIDSAGEIGPVIELMNATIPQSGVELDVARYPNPFIGVAKDSFIDSAQTVLSFVDGGEDGQVIPLQPLLVKAREVDVILALDAVRVNIMHLDCCS
jgi:lysophospholipase